MLQEFKALFDNVESGIRHFFSDHERVCDYLEIDLTNGYSRTYVIDKLLDLIKQKLTPKEEEISLNPKQIADLTDALVYQCVLENVDNTSYLTALRIISGKNQSFIGLDCTDRWTKALVYVKDFELFSPNVYTVTKKNLRAQYAKKYDFAISALALKKMGCEVALDDVLLKIGDLKPIATSIEDRIRKIGGVTIMRHIFKHLIENGFFYPVYNRYLITNDVTMLSDHRQPMIPFGYVLNLSVKYPFEAARASSDKTNLNKDFQFIFTTSIHLGVITNAQFYGTWELLFQRVEDLPFFVIRLALFDSGFSFPCADSRIIVQYIESLFKWVDLDRFKNKFSFQINDLIAVAKVIIKQSNENGPKYIYTSQIKRQLPQITPKTLEVILDHLSHIPGYVNKNYYFLTDYEELDFGFKPLIKLANGQFLFCDRSWCVSGFYEVLATLIRELDTYEHECNNKVGQALEQLLYLKFADKNINLSHGPYAKNVKPAGEADGIIETNKYIGLIELKKKVLTRKAKSGSDIKLIIDLVGSLLDAQYQNNRTELILRKNGFIDLKTSGGISRISHNNRLFEKIALTHWEFGSFQDRSIINTFLKILIKSQIGIIDKTDLESIASFLEINKKKDAFVTQLNELQQLDPYHDEPFFDCWFLSVPQILMILQFCTGNEQFLEVLRTTKHLILGSSNFYKEFYYGYIKSKNIQV